MKRKLILLAIIAFVFGLFMCDTTWGIEKFCGEPEGKRKVFIDSLNHVHAKVLVVKEVPCYFGYLEVRCKREVSEKLLDSIGSSAQALGWIEVLVYNTEGFLIRGETGSM